MKKNRRIWNRIISALLILAVAAGIWAAGAAEAQAASGSKSYLIAHGGLSAKAPFGSAEAYKKAGRSGKMYAAECDLRWTKDHVLCISHDDTLNRYTNRRGLIENKTWKYVKNAVIDYKTRGIRGQKILSFSDYLDICKKYGMVALVDLKWASGKVAMAKAAYQMAKKKGMADQVIWQGPYSMRDCLNAIYKLDHRARLWYLTAGVVTKKAIRRAKKYHCEAVNTDRVTKASVRSVHKNGLRIAFYQTSKQKTIKKYRSWGVDYIMTNG